MKLSLSEIEFSLLRPDQVNLILNLQDRVIASLENKEILRENTAQMFYECVLTPNISIGAFYKGTLIGIGVLYYATTIEEDLSHLLVGVDIAGKKVANYKLVMVDKKYRGNGLQVHFGKLLEKYAKENGVTLLCSTVSPLNKYSETNMLKLGYTLSTTLKKYGSIRNLFYKFI